MNVRVLNADWKSSLKCGVNVATDEDFSSIAKLWLIKKIIRFKVTCTNTHLMNLIILCVIAINLCNKYVPLKDRQRQTEQSKPFVGQLTEVKK